jgi:transcriptional regulator with XRE-family HTH domain
MDRAQLADFLRTRREALQPEDVGLPRGKRRRTDGLRREEVAALCDMSADYYARIEQQRGTRPSEQMLAAMARGLHLSLDERDHLFRLAGHVTPHRTLRSEHVSPGLMRILDRLSDTPAQVMSELGETLLQTPPAVALLGDQTRYTGLSRSMVYRWFTDPDTRWIYPEDDHTTHGRIFTADLRANYTRLGLRSRAAAIVDALLAESKEFEALWSEHEVGVKHLEVKRIQNPEVGVLEVHCQILYDSNQSQLLLVFTATPGSESYDKLQLLSVIGNRQLAQ